MTKGCTILLIAFLSFSLASCSIDDVASSAAVSVLPVAVAGYGSAYAGKAGWQNTSIVLGAPDVLYAEEINFIPSPAFDAAYAKLPVFKDDYWYMGSRDEYHYVMHYPPFGLRNVLKIKKSKHDMPDPFPLTSRSKSWRRLNASSPFVINDLPPELLEDRFEFDLLPGYAIPRLHPLYRIEVDVIVPDAVGVFLPADEIMQVQPFEPFSREQPLDDEPAEPSPRK